MRRLRKQYNPHAVREGGPTGGRLSLALAATPYAPRSCDDDRPWPVVNGPPTGASSVRQFRQFLLRSRAARERPPSPPPPPVATADDHHRETTLAASVPGQDALTLLSFSRRASMIGAMERSRSRSREEREMMDERSPRRFDDDHDKTATRQQHLPSVSRSSSDADRSPTTAQRHPSRSSPPKRPLHPPRVDHDNARETVTRRVLDRSFRYPLDFSAGVALRERVLLPTLRSRADHPRRLSEKESGIRLSRLFRGERVWTVDPRTANDATTAPAEVRRCDARDATELAAWYADGGDRYLPGTDSTWSDWWATRCRSPDPSCEMLKLVTPSNGDDGEVVLGVVYYERNVADALSPRRPRTTLLRGLRTRPDANPEVARRCRCRRRPPNATNDDDADAARDESHRRLMITLVTAVIARSLLCGTSGIGVNATKSPMEEDFWIRIFGEPAALREDDGRRYYAMRGEERFRFLRAEFERQIDLEDASRRAMVAESTNATQTVVKSLPLPRPRIPPPRAQQLPPPPSSQQSQQKPQQQPHGRPSPETVVTRTTTTGTTEPPRYGMPGVVLTNGVAARVPTEPPRPIHGQHPVSRPPHVALRNGSVLYKTMREGNGNGSVVYKTTRDGNGNGNMDNHGGTANGHYDKNPPPLPQHPPHARRRGDEPPPPPQVPYRRNVNVRTYSV